MRDETDEQNVPDPFAAARRTQKQQIDQYTAERLVDSKYSAERTYLTRVSRDFAFAVKEAALAFTRYAEGKHWLLQDSMDSFIEGAIGIWALASQGSFNIGRRELRYLLELAVKAVYVDQSLPGNTPLSNRIDFVSNTANVPRSSVDVIDNVVVRMLPDRPNVGEAVHSTFGQLSGYTHVSRRQLEERVRRFERGEFLGMESAATIRAFNRALFTTYDLVLTLIFEGIGPSFTGDLFITLFDDRPDWKFHRAPFAGRVSRYFDYKVERRARGQSPPAP